MNYKVVETFVSINGEGKKAGQLSVFIRFLGCNLNCSYCDTKWANEKDAPFVWMSEEDIYHYIKEQHVTNVTLTGGEPLLQENIECLLEKLAEDDTLYVEIETNGSVPIERYKQIKNGPSMTMDYKLPESGMMQHMLLDNYKHITKEDTIKFVAGSKDDLYQAKKIIETYQLTEKCSVYLSPVFGKIEPADMVEFMIEEKLNGVNLQLQLHKFIWDPDKKGV